MQKFCALFEIDLEKIEDRKIPQKIGNGEAVLIGCWNYEKAGSHCVRFCEYLNKERFRVMDPAPLRGEDKFPEMETGQINEWSCEVFRIRLKDSPKAAAVSTQSTSPSS